MKLKKIFVNIIKIIIKPNYSNQSLILQDDQNISNYKFWKSKPDCNGRLTKAWGLGGLVNAHSKEL